MDRETFSLSKLFCMCNSEDFQTGRVHFGSQEYFIVTIDWLMESIQILPKLDGFFKAEVNIPAKIMQFILNLKSWQKLIKNRSVGNIGF